jgi:hypothetical protein
MLTLPEDKRRLTNADEVSTAFPLVACRGGLTMSVHSGTPEVTGTRSK